MSNPCLLPQTRESIISGTQTSRRLTPTQVAIAYLSACLFYARSKQSQEAAEQIRILTNITEEAQAEFEQEATS